MTANFKNWHKSSFSGGAGENCVEKGIDEAAGVVGVRDTKQGTTSPVLAFPGSQWTAFVSGLNNGHLGGPAA
jgi:hypothetical protein